MRKSGCWLKKWVIILSKAMKEALHYHGLILRRGYVIVVLPCLLYVNFLCPQVDILFVLYIQIAGQACSNSV